MARTVLELRCISCGVKFERSFEKRRGDPDNTEGEMVRLEGSTCPNKCNGEWFAVEKSHPIRKFKRTFGG